jgi:hypothetical protein
MCCTIKARCVYAGLPLRLTLCCCACTRDILLRLKTLARDTRQICMYRVCLGMSYLTEPLLLMGGESSVVLALQGQLQSTVPQAQSKSGSLSDGYTDL